MERIKLAVYGTLKSDHKNHEILGPDAKVLARGIRVPNMSLYDISYGWYPAAVRDEEGPGVEVEVVDIPVSVLRVVDDYEGYHEDAREGYSLFTREAVILPNGDECVMYLYNRLPNERQGDFYKLIPSGKWKDTFDDEVDDIGYQN
jgi:gamma-glutamylcyclotransferase (GGCT)/AIG2-like uncharacterized protein YtfP